MTRIISVFFVCLACAWCDEPKVDRLCERSAFSATSIADELRAECVELNGSRQDSGSPSAATNLLQMHSKRSSQLPTAAVKASEPNAGRRHEHRASDITASIQVGELVKSGQKNKRAVATAASEPAAAPASKPVQEDGVAAASQPVQEDGVAAARMSVAHFFAEGRSRVSLFIVGLVLLFCACAAVFVMRNADIERDLSAGLIAPRSAGMTDSWRLSLQQVWVPMQPDSPSGKRLSPGSPPLAPGPIISKHLCTGLVVPLGNECHLAVPVLSAPRDSSKATVAFDVEDLHDNCVVSAEVVLPNLFDSQRDFEVPDRPFFVLLRPGGGQRVLAYCKTAVTSSLANARKRVCIYDAQDELYAMIEKDSTGSRYTLSSDRKYMNDRLGLQLYIEGDSSKRIMRVMDDRGQCVAETSPESSDFKPSGSYYRLRVGQGIDVGIVLCSLFSVYRLELA